MGCVTLVSCLVVIAAPLSRCLEFPYAIGRAPTPPPGASAIEDCARPRRGFATVEELRRIDTRTLTIAGDDPRHPTQLARTLADVLADAVLAEATMSDLLVNADDLAHAFAPAIEQFLATSDRDF